MKTNVRRRKAAEYRVRVLERQIENRQRYIAALKSEVDTLDTQLNLAAAMNALILKKSGCSSVGFTEEELIGTFMRGEEPVIIPDDENEKSFTIRLKREGEEIDGD